MTRSVCSNCFRWKQDSNAQGLGYCRWPWPAEPQPKNMYLTRGVDTCEHWVHCDVYEIDVIHMDQRRAKQKGLPPMTRDEVVNKLKALPLRIDSLREPDCSWFVDALIALDLLKVEESFDPRTRAVATLRDQSVSAYGWKPYPDAHLQGAGLVKLSGSGAITVIETLEAAGLTIVRKDQPR